MRIGDLQVEYRFPGQFEIRIGFGWKPGHDIRRQNQITSGASKCRNSIEDIFRLITSFHSFQDYRRGALQRKVNMWTNIVVLAKSIH